MARRRPRGDALRAEDRGGGRRLRARGRGPAGLERRRSATTAPRRDRRCGAMAGKPLKLRFKNALKGPTSLAFPGCRIANSVSGFSGLTGAAIPAGRRAGDRHRAARSRLQSLLALWAAERPRAARRGPVRPAGRRRALPAAGGPRRGRRVFAARRRLARECRDGAADARRAAGRAGAPAARQRHSRSVAVALCLRRNRACDRRRRRPERNVRAARRGIPDGAELPLRTDARPASRPASA